MELLQLKYFQLVAKHENISKVAEQLNISQPSLSKTIALLEKELGTNLFDRCGRNIILNDNGRDFLSYIDNALMNIENGINRIKDENKMIQCDMKILILTGVPQITPIITTFIKRYQNVDFKIKHYNIGHNDDDFDICLTSPPIEENRYNIVHLLTEPIGIAIPKSHQLANKPKITLSDLKYEKFICLNPNKALSKIMGDVSFTFNFAQNNILETDDPNIAKEFIDNGLGIAFMPMITINKELMNSNIIIRSVEDLQKEISTILLTRKDKYESLIIRLFKQHVINHFNSLIAGKI
ncbi:MAG: LysR family transcriptional regulator [Firmicutes bacterium]|nr:LysR family transcriptional regulator [Bacillota bacterium]